jgi:metal-responsive CopG/Arc/MetJ family transcriptional regulator
MHTQGNTDSRTAKIAISLPQTVLAEVDRAARERGESRSGFIRRILLTATRIRRDAEVTRRLDAIFSAPAAVQEQERVMRELDAAGTDWSDETW